MIAISKVLVFFMFISLYCQVSSLEESDSLLHYWPMSSLKDVRGSADLYGGANFTLTCDRFKKKSSAFYFTRGYVQIPPGYYLSGDRFTVSLWFQLISYKMYSALINFGNGQNIDEVDFTMVDKTNRIEMESLNSVNGVNDTQVDAGPIDLNKWYQVTFVHKKSMGIIYINGKKDSTAPFKITENVFRAFNFIGKSNFPTDEEADAIIDEIKIYNKALSARQIYENFKKSSQNGMNYFFFFCFYIRNIFKRFFSFLISLYGLQLFI